MDLIRKDLTPKKIMTRFWVIGGAYADTNFDRIQGGGKEERDRSNGFHGLLSYPEARQFCGRAAGRSPGAVVPETPEARDRICPERGRMRNAVASRRTRTPRC